MSSTSSERKPQVQGGIFIPRRTQQDVHIPIQAHDNGSQLMFGRDQGTRSNRVDLRIKLPDYPLDWPGSSWDDPEVYCLARVSACVSHIVSWMAVPVSAVKEAEAA